MALEAGLAPFKWMLSQVGAILRHRGADHSDRCGHRQGGNNSRGARSIGLPFFPWRVVVHLSEGGTQSGQELVRVSEAILADLANQQVRFKGFHLGSRQSSHGALLYRLF